MTLHEAIVAYLKFHDANLGDDYFDAERRAVRLPLDAAIHRWTQRDIEATPDRIAAIQERFDELFEGLTRVSARQQEIEARLRVAQQARDDAEARLLSLQKKVLGIEEKTT